MQSFIVSPSLQNYQLMIVLKHAARKRDPPKD